MADDEIFMEFRALEFMREWPEVSDNLRPVYSRIKDAGLIWIDPNVDSDGRDFPGCLRLTENGVKLKQIIDAQTYSCFDPKVVLPLCVERIPGAIDAVFKKEGRRAPQPLTKPKPTARAPLQPLTVLLTRLDKQLQRLVEPKIDPVAAKIADLLLEAEAARLYGRLFARDRREEFEAQARKHEAEAQALKGRK